MKKPLSDHLLHFLHTKVAFAHRKPTEKWRSSSKRRTPFSSDYRFECRKIVDGPSIKSPSFLSRGTYFSSDNSVPRALTTTR